MKKLVPAEKRSGRIVSTTLVAFALILLSGLSPAFSSPTYSDVSKLNNDTILVQRQQTSRKHKIKLYPNATHEVLFFSANGEDGKAYQLFLFDIEGKLVKQVNIKNKQTTVLNNIDKGDYLFEVFSDDLRIGKGQVIVR